jgi:hypothetical protein
LTLFPLVSAAVKAVLIQRKDGPYEWTPVERITRISSFVNSRSAAWLIGDGANPPRGARPSPFLTSQPKRSGARRGRMRIFSGPTAAVAALRSRIGAQTLDSTQFRCDGKDHGDAVQPHPPAMIGDDRPRSADGAAFLFRRAPRATGDRPILLRRPEV